LIPAFAETPVRRKTLGSGASCRQVAILIFAFILSAYLSVSNYDFFKNVNAQFLLLSLSVIWPAYRSET